MFQQLTIVGNLGTDPEMRYTPSGVAVTNFRVAVNEKHKDQETTTWIKVACFNKLAELTNQYLTKGRQILAVGTVKGSAYLDREGKPACSLEMIANTVQFLNGGKQEQGVPAGQPTSGDEPDDLASIPF